MEPIGNRGSSTLAQHLAAEGRVSGRRWAPSRRPLPGGYMRSNTNMSTATPMGRTRIQPNERCHPPVDAGRSSTSDGETGLPSPLPARVTPRPPSTARYRCIERYGRQLQRRASVSLAYVVEDDRLAQRGVVRGAVEIRDHDEMADTPDVFPDLGDDVAAIDVSPP